MEIRKTNKCKERDRNYTYFAIFRYLPIVLKGAHVFYLLIVIYRRFGQSFYLHLFRF